MLITGRGLIGSHLEGDFWEKKEGNNILNISKSPKHKLVIHTAASFEGESMYEDNILGTIAVVDQCKKWGAKLIFLSSAAVYGNNDNAKEDDPLRPINQYGVSKQFGEWYIRRELKDWVILRLANVYGKGGRGVINRWLDEGAITINGDGKQVRDFVHVDDVVEAINRAKDWQGIYNVSSGNGLTINDLAEEIRYSTLNNGKLKKEGLTPRTI